MFTARFQLVFCLGVLSIRAAVSAQTDANAPATPAATAPDAQPYVGEVIGNDVYVRSGPSANYYPVAKLRAGNRVKVYEEKSGWLSIEPPAGCFSLIHKNFVDVGPDQKEGVVNGENVQIRAGSEMEPQLYAKQLKLDKGAVVTVLQPHNDDYLRIAPPPGARLYISRDFVTRSSIPVAAMDSTEAVAFTGSTESTSESPAPTAVPDSTSPAEAPTKAEAPAKKPSAHQEEMDKVNAMLRAEETKPLLQRDYSAVLAKYEKLAEQKDDEKVKTFAQARVKQVRDAAEAVHLIKEVRDLGASVADVRKDALQQRDRIKPVTREIGGGFDVTGELRESMIYRGSAASPRRYRVVGEDGSRTLGYIEIPSDLKLDVDKVLGRQVGVRARERKLQTEDVDPVPVFVASEIVVLDIAPGGGRDVRP